jgi:hypothetical protein
MIILKILLHINLKRNCGDKALEDNRKLRYYKDVINPIIEDEKYISILTRVKKKTNFAKIRTNSHELHS